MELICKMNVKSYGFIDTKEIPVTLEKDTNKLLVKGPKGELSKEFNKLIIENFYNNCLVLRNELDKLFMAVGFDLDNIDKDNYNDLLKMVNLLEEICFVNRGKYGIIALFEKINDNNYNMFFMQYELLFTMYKKKWHFVMEYRNFKESSI